jgi:hypothetical protein
MPNLVLTYLCNNQCPYCFAESRQERHQFSLEQVRHLVPLLKQVNSGGVNLVGGEPTLNRSFLPILELLLTEGLQVNIFTGGRIPPGLLDSLQLIQEGSFTFCVNRSTGPIAAETIRLYHKMGYRVHLAATVFQSDQSLHHLLDEITAYNLERHYRLGLALPVWPDRRNTHLDPTEYRVLAAHLFEFIRTGVDSGIRPLFDCGFPYCFFDAEQRKFFQDNGIDFSSHCGPIPDFCPDSSAIPCFPLRDLGVAVAQLTRWDELKAALEGRLTRVRERGIFARCTGCRELLEGKCSGGCAALKTMS